MGCGGSLVDSTPLAQKHIYEKPQLFNHLMTMYFKQLGKLTQVVKDSTKDQINLQCLIKSNFYIALLVPGRPTGVATVGTTGCCYCLLSLLI